MRRDTSTLVKAAFATVLGLVCIPHAGSAQKGPPFPPPGPPPGTASPSPPYNPYPTLPGFMPPSILPPNLDSEIARVQREVQTIFDRYFAEWKALTPTPTYTGNPPTLFPNGYDAVRILGGLLNFDSSMSPNKNRACSFCHMPYAGFSGPIPSVNLTMIAYPGSAHFRAGKRTAQRYTYSSYFPPLQYNATQGAFFGGNFWDSRATGYLLRSTD